MPKSKILIAFTLLISGLVGESHANSPRQKFFDISRDNIKPGCIIIATTDSGNVEKISGIKITSISKDSFNYINYEVPGYYLDKYNYNSSYPTLNKPNWMQKTRVISHENILGNFTSKNSDSALRFNKTMAIDTLLKMQNYGKLAMARMAKLKWWEAMSDIRNLNSTPKFKMGDVFKFPQDDKSVAEEWKVVRINEYGVCFKRTPTSEIDAIKDSVSIENVKDIYSAVAASYKLLDFSNIQDLLNNPDFKKIREEKIYKWEILAMLLWPKTSKFDMGLYENSILYTPNEYGFMFEM